MLAPSPSLSLPALVASRSVSVMCSVCTTELPSHSLVSLLTTSDSELMSLIDLFVLIVVFLFQSLLNNTFDSTCSYFILVTLNLYFLSTRSLSYYSFLYLLWAYINIKVIFIIYVNFIFVYFFKKDVCQHFFIFVSLCFGIIPFRTVLDGSLGGRHIIVLYNIVIYFLAGSLEVAPPDALGPKPNIAFQKLSSYYDTGQPPVH